MAESISNQVANAYDTDYFKIKIFMFFSKNYLTRVFLFFCRIKISYVQRYWKISSKSLEKNCQCIFQTANVLPPVF